LLLVEPALALEPPVPTLPPPSGPVAALPAEPPVVELLPQPVQAAEAMINVASRLRAIRILILRISSQNWADRVGVRAGEWQHLAAFMT
jgi:hypothetical protein